MALISVWPETSVLESSSSSFSNSSSKTNGKFDYEDENEDEDEPNPAVSGQTLIKRGLAGTPLP